MIYIVLIFAALFGILHLYGYRNDLVYKMQKKSIVIAMDHRLEESVLRIDEYDLMIWQLTKWRFKDFYPHLAEYDR